VLTLQIEFPLKQAFSFSSHEPILVTYSSACYKTEKYSFMKFLIDFGGAKGNVKKI